VIIAVMSNVVMLNFCYDVPVKIYSVHLLSAAVYLVVRDLKRLANLLVFNRATEPSDLGPRRSRRWFAVKVVVILAAFYQQAEYRWEAYHKYGMGAPEPALAGAWSVTSMKRNGVELPPLETDERRWRWFLVSRRGTGVRGMSDDRRAFHKMTYDAATSTVTLTGDGQPQPWVLRATRDGDELRLVGFYDLAPVEITLKKREFLLETRGFHWVNDYPFNR
jgi:hypothetical protein